MASKLLYHDAATGNTVYAIMWRLSDGFVWNDDNSAWEDPTDTLNLSANWGEHNISMPEVETDTQYHTANLPTGMGSHEVAYHKIYPGGRRNVGRWVSGQGMRP